MRRAEEGLVLPPRAASAGICTPLAVPVDGLARRVQGLGEVSGLEGGRFICLISLLFRALIGSAAVVHNVSASAHHD